MDKHKNTIFYFGISGVFLFVVTTIIAGLLIDNYSHTSQFISESYAIGTPYGLYLRFLGFIPSGIFITLFAILSIKVFPKVKNIKLSLIGVALFYGVGTILVSVFPCDASCNKEFIDPSISQIIHNFSGSLTYLFVPFSILLFGIGLLKVNIFKTLSISSIIFGLMSMFFVVMLMSNENSRFVGLIQRIIEGNILLWILFTSFFLKKKVEQISNRKKRFVDV